VTEFELHRVEVTADRPYEKRACAGVEILIIVESDDDAPIAVETNDRSWDMKKGQTMLVPHGTTYTVRTQGPAVFYKAITP
jgi:hypothetical protein